MKLWKWLVAAVIFVAGVFFTSQARSHKERAGRLVDKAVAKEQSKKQSHLKKAQQLGAQATASMDKSAASLKRSKQLQKKLEERNETGLANRVRDFNNSL